MLKVYDITPRYIDQPPKRKKLVIDIIEPYHPDISDFLSLKKDVMTDDEHEQRARDMSYMLQNHDELLLNDILDNESNENSHSKT
jgi:hypothetical protein